MSIPVISTNNSKLDPTQNHVAPYLDPSFKTELERIGGHNRFGTPMFQIVWGCDATHIRMGGFHKKYLTGRKVDWITKQDPQSGLFKRFARVEEIGLSRWVIETWLPPEHWGLESWEKARWSNEDGIIVDVLGPFPERGDYRHYMTVEDSKGEYKLPDQEDLAMIAQAVWDWKHPQENLTPEQEAVRDYEASTVVDETASDEAGTEIRVEKAELVLGQDLQEEVALHAHRVIDPHRANRGGSGHRVFLPGEDKAKPEASIIIQGK